MCSLLHYVRCIPLLKDQDIPGYSGFYPRINGYIVNCTRFCTKVARNFIFLDALASDPGMAWNVVVS